MHSAVSFRKMPEITEEVPGTPGRYTAGEAQPLKGHVQGTWFIGASTQQQLALVTVVLCKVKVKWSLHYTMMTYVGVAA